MSSFEQLLERIFTSLGWNEPTPEWIPPSANQPHSPAFTATSTVGRRELYSSAHQASWGIADTPEGSTSGWQSFLHGPPATESRIDGDHEVPPPNRRKRPALVGLTAFPTPRGLLVAQGRR